MLTARPGLTMKAALFLGFGVTIGLWLVTGYSLTQRFAAAEAAAGAFNSRYLRAQEALREVESRTRLASVLLRDALLAPEPGATISDREAIEGAHLAAAAALRQYVPVTNARTELDGIARLQTEVEAFRVASFAVIANFEQSPESSRRLISQRAVPLRETVLRSAARLQAGNRDAFVAQTLSTARVYRDAQRQGWQRLGLALAINLAIGIWVVAYTGRLESRLQQQRQRDLELTNDLHRLSSKIVSAQEDERRMIARELHDEVGQTLAAIRVDLEFAQRPGADAATIAARLEDVRVVTEGALQTIRDLSHLLHPAMLDDLGLIEALESLTRAFAARHELRVELRHSGMTSRLAPELETAIYRIVQEALSNVAKHARAGLCSVTIERSGNRVRVRVEDDGVGLPSSRNNEADAGADTEVTKRGIGLIGVRERATLLGGQLTVTSARSAGTRIDVELPIRKDSGEHISADLSR